MIEDLLHGYSNGRDDEHWSFDRQVEPEYSGSKDKDLYPTYGTKTVSSSKREYPSSRKNVYGDDLSAPNNSRITDMTSHIPTRVTSRSTGSQTHTQLDDSEFDDST